MTKTNETQQTYLVLVDISNDATGKHFKSGATVTSADFSAAVIKNWLEIGVLKVKEEKS